MLEYVLFSAQLRDRFAHWLEDNGIVYRTEGDGDELLVLVDEDLDGEIQDSVDEQYDLLLEESAKLADAEDNPADAIHAVGIQFQRSDATVGLVRITPELANRLHRCLDMVELQAFVQAVVDAAEDPDSGQLCRR
jgi:hypothetical protein